MKTSQLPGQIAISPAEPALSLSKGTTENVPGRKSWATNSGAVARSSVEWAGPAQAQLLGRASGRVDVLLPPPVKPLRA